MVKSPFPAKSADEGDPAAAMHTLAVLLRAGAGQLVAWNHLASTGEPHAERVMQRHENGQALVEAIEAEGGGWRDFAAAWEIATTVGAPLSDVLTSLAGAIRDAASGADDVRIALAEPAATARLLMWLPLAGLVLGVALGFDTFAVALTPIGATVVLLGLLLLVLGRVWTGSLIRKAQPSGVTPGIHSELVAVALSGGASVERAMQMAGDRDDTGSRTEQVLELSSSAGIPAVELLRASASQDRHDARVEGRLRAAKLSTKLLVPLGVCTLPAFLLLGVFPLGLSVLTTTPLPL